MCEVPLNVMSCRIPFIAIDHKDNKQHSVILYHRSTHRNSALIIHLDLNVLNADYQQSNIPSDGVPRRGERSTRSYNSRRSSTDSSEDGFNQNVRDLKSELKELEEKFRKAMVANASLDNEKCQLMFQVFYIYKDSAHIHLRLLTV